MYNTSQNKALFNVLIIITVIAAFVPLSARAESTILINVTDHATVCGKKIFLTDIADFNDTGSLAQMLESFSIGTAPDPGKEKLFSGSRIISIIRSKRWMPKNAQIFVPEVVCVSRSYQSIPKHTLEKLFHDYISKTTKKIDFQITGFNVRGTKKFPEGEINYSTFDKSKKHNRITGRMNLKTTVFVEGEKAGLLYMSGMVNIYENVVCAARTIKRGSILTENDIHVERINISNAPPNLVTFTESAIGKRLRRTIEKNACIRVNMLESPPVIQKGDKIKIVARNGLLKIVTTGRAKSDGKKGEQIRVENLNSNKIIFGNVVDSSTVTILF